jgi:two-component system OmpR family response regulator
MGPLCTQQQRIYMARILVVDDEARIRDVLQYALERDGHTVICAADGTAALDIVRQQAEAIDLIVLDVLMPELDGLSVCRELRRDSQIPIIFLSSRGEEIDRILGLELGGDDYVSKPFSPRELVTRVKTVLRRAASVGLAPVEKDTPDKIMFQRLCMDLGRHEVRVDSHSISLTVSEFSLLRTLLSQPARAFTRATLLDRVCGDDVYVTERTIDTHVRRIRQKLEPFGIDPIETVHGVGYRARELGT